MWGLLVTPLIGNMYLSGIWLDFYLRVHNKHTYVTMKVDYVLDTIKSNIEFELWKG